MLAQRELWRAVRRENRLDWRSSGTHPQQCPWAVIEHGPSDLQGVVARVPALADSVGQYMGHLLADYAQLGKGPFQAIRVREESDLFVGWQHVESFFHDPDHRGWKEVMPPVSGEAQVGQFPRQRTQRLVRMRAREKTLKPQFRMAADHVGQLRNGLLGKAATCFVWQRLGAKAELEHDLLGMLFERRQECLVDVRGVDVAFRRPGRCPPRQSLLHVAVRHGTKLDVGRDVGGGRKHLIIRNAGDVMPNRIAHIVECVNRPFGGGSATRSDRRGTLRLASPTPLQFVQRRVKLAPLAACEESPLQGVLQTVVVLPLLATRDLRSGANDVHAVQ